MSHRLSKQVVSLVKLAASNLGKVHRFLLNMHISRHSLPEQCRLPLQTPFLSAMETLSSGGERDYRGKEHWRRWGKNAVCALAVGDHRWATSALFLIIGIGKTPVVLKLSYQCSVKLRRFETQSVLRGFELFWIFLAKSFWGIVLH